MQDDAQGKAGAGMPREGEHLWRGFLRPGIVDGAEERGEDEGQGLYLLVPSWFLSLPIQTSQVQTLPPTWVVFPAPRAALMRSQVRIKLCRLGPGKS